MFSQTMRLALVRQAASLGRRPATTRRAWAAVGSPRLAIQPSSPSRMHMAPSPSSIGARQLSSSAQPSPQAPAIDHDMDTPADVRGATSGPLFAFDQLVASGQSAPDPSQRAACIVLQRVHNQLNASVAAAPAAVAPAPAPAPAGGWMGSLRSSLGRVVGLGGSAAQAPAPSTSGAGVYLYGGVGTGKTRIMNLLFDTQGPHIPKQRIHFHAFMLDVHARVHRLRSEEPATVDPLQAVARQLAGRMRLLCLDELQVTDIADAMVVKNLFETMINNGVTIIFTSNRHPSELYLRGINREHFLPFIDMVIGRFNVVQVGKTGLDYRSLVASGAVPTQQDGTPAPEAQTAHPAAPGAAELEQLRAPLSRAYASRELEHLADPYFEGFDRAAGLADAFAAVAERDLGTLMAAGPVAAALVDPARRPAVRAATRISIGVGRWLDVEGMVVWPDLAADLEQSTSSLDQTHARRHPAVLVDYKTLCGSARGAADYISLAQRFRRVFLTNVPSLTVEQKDELRRLITLIDVLYETGSLLVMHSQCPVEAIYVDQGPPPTAAELAAAQQAAPGSGHEERFAFARTHSRLTEMRSSAWARSAAREWAREDCDALAGSSQPSQLR
ncbi:hypothetical protein H696_00642 [Fonticula alba]|uniref:Uncharacterized protein n=1 Tax=Fonticula alba TaxID=691883 RepID=A0A058ZHW2_FONAL|nr:hypothetical protein H696_00642 [Fonticula alba]KCV73097.1 hypothetical protein H696_00642 [Fonticula alba]|eukprot:XP_009492798.1 hypothetical protein H696_00642 [Fonticula alba]